MTQVHKSTGKPGRTYVSAVRTAAARRTRRRILRAAGTLFVERGYRQTTVADVAQAAGVAVDTVYASVGRKPELVRLLLETAISGGDEPVPAGDRDYVAAIRAEPAAAAKLALYAAAIARIMPRIAPIVRVCREAGEPELLLLWREIADRRAQNMRDLVAELAATGRLRRDLDLDLAADQVWATNSPELFELLVGQRGWPIQTYRQWLADTWARLLLAPDSG